MDSSSHPGGAIGSGGGERNQREEEAAATEAGNGSQLVMPEDGYEWKKYGQKFIKNIQKIRSYFRCRHRLCGAKKKVEWHPRGPSGDLRIVYEGAHQHGAPEEAAAIPGAQLQGGGASYNRYELGAQYFGGARSQ
ncbi:WRKY transcription factor 71-like [Miscanthus floridulus]|uniref:WRKY transcription factor 71-like n=1 Tax=Miscanthus floridulus TaxID=154761 RepID=UPI00345B40CA